MPRVKIGHAYGVTIEIEAAEASAEASAGDLEALAMKSYREATEIQAQVSAGPAAGFTAEKRWTVDHRDTGFAPVKAEQP